MDSLLKSFYKEINIGSQSYFGAALILVKVLGAIIIPFIIQSIVHELGHLIFGLLTGYKSWIFRVFNMALVKDKGKYSLKLCSHSEALGQCLMLPLGNTNRKGELGYSYGLYNLGGVILNFISGIIFLFLTLELKDISIYSWLFLVFNMLYGIGFSIINGLPFIENNDGHNYILLNRDYNAQESYNRQLNIFYELYQGKTYGEIEFKKIKVHNQIDLSNSIILWHKMMECYYYMDLNRWDRAKGCIEAFRPFINNLSINDRIFLYLEELYLSIVTKEPSDKIEKLFELTKEFIKKNRSDINVYRVETAYKIYKNSRFTIIYDSKVNTNKLEKYSFYKGIRRFTYKQLDTVKKIYT